MGPTTTQQRPNDQLTMGPCIEKENCLELQMTVMSLRVIQSMIMNLCTKLKICVWAVAIFVISGLVQYMFIKTYNIYNPHWVDWTHQKAVVTIDLQAEQVPAVTSDGSVELAGVRKTRKLNFPSLEENAYHLYVGNFVSRDKLGITICTFVYTCPTPPTPPSPSGGPVRTRVNLKEWAIFHDSRYSRQGNIFRS